MFSLGKSLPYNSNTFINISYVLWNIYESPFNWWLSSLIMEAYNKVLEASTKSWTDFCNEDDNPVETRIWSNDPMILIFWNIKGLMLCCMILIELITQYLMGCLRSFLARGMKLEFIFSVAKKNNFTEFLVGFWSPDQFVVL